MDDEGILRDDFDTFSKHTSNTHWTDSGLGADKQSAGSSSTLRQFDLQSYPSFDDVSHDPFEERVNISDLEASKDDLSFDNETFDRDFDKDFDNELEIPDDSRKSTNQTKDSSFDQSLNFDESEDHRLKTESYDHKTLFDNDYYKQLQDLGVLIDDSELSNPKNSLSEFEKLEHNLSTENLVDIEKSDNIDAIGEFLKRDIQSPIRESVDGSIFLDSGHQSPVDSETHSPTCTRPNTADSARTISSRSFPEISPEEALKYFNEQIQHHEQEKLQLVDNDAASIEFDNSESQKTGDDDELFLITGPMTDHLATASVPSYDNVNYDPGMLSSHIHDSSSDHHNFSNYSNGNVSSSFDVNEILESRPVAALGFVPMTYVEDHSIDNLDDRLPTPTAFVSTSFGRDTSADSGDHTPTGNTQHSFNLHLSLEDQGILNDTRNSDSFINSHRSEDRSEDGSITPRSEAHNDSIEQSLSEKSRLQSESNSRRRNDSETSHKSSTSESPMTKQVQSNEEQANKMSKAHSQESFFQANKPVKNEKGHKRLLPKPTVSDSTQSFRVKSKSTTNISRSGPLKPTHMSLTEISGLHMEEMDNDQTEPLSTASDKSKGELTSKLKQEFHKRKQATELVQQLQVDYDKLLSKYALAELTIDQLRLGAKITLHSESPTPSQATSGSLPGMQHLQVLQLGQAANRAVILSPYQALSSPFSPTSGKVFLYNLLTVFL